MKKHSGIVVSLLAVVAALLSGCADLDLDRAHQNGQLSDADYWKLKSQREAQRRQQTFLEQEAFQQRQNQIMSDYARSINTAPATPMFSTPFLQSRPGGAGIGDAPVQQQPNLPSGLDLNQMQKRQGTPTGRTKVTVDGIWYEYRTISGSTYWSLER